jgi:tetratricopeptide (TPR) repeat protein
LSLSVRLFIHCSSGYQFCCLLSFIINSEFYYNIGVVYTSSNKFKEAIETYEKTIEIKPDYYEAYYGIGVAYAMLNEFDKALEAYEKAIVLNSELIIKLSKQQNWYPLP